MSKKVIYIIIGIMAILLIAVVSICFLLNRTIYLSENSNFKKIYNYKNNISDIEIDVIDEKDNKISTITNKEDVSNILNTLKDERIDPNVKLGEELLGGTYKFIIKNKVKNNDVEIMINNTQVTINDKTYKTENNLKEKLREIYLKYYTI